MEEKENIVGNVEKEFQELQKLDWNQEVQESYFSEMGGLGTLMCC